MFSKRQFRFLERQSTVAQLLTILDRWTECLEFGGQIDVIHTNLEKAFDTVPHKRLISKLKSYGVNKGIISWTVDFVNNRKQNVMINRFYSFWTSVFIGVLQRSI